MMKPTGLDGGLSDSSHKAPLTQGLGPMMLSQTTIHLVPPPPERRLYDHGGSAPTVSSLLNVQLEMHDDGFWWPRHIEPLNGETSTVNVGSADQSPEAQAFDFALPQLRQGEVECTKFQTVAVQDINFIRFLLISLLFWKVVLRTDPLQRRSRAASTIDLLHRLLARERYVIKLSRGKACLCIGPHLHHHRALRTCLEGAQGLLLPTCAVHPSSREGAGQGQREPRTPPHCPHTSMRDVRGRILRTISPDSSQSSCRMKWNGMDFTDPNKYLFSGPTENAG
eukprot:gene24736-biopygen1004